LKENVASLQRYLYSFEKPRLELVALPPTAT